MGKFQFTEDDYNLLKGLIDITSAIKDTYEDLYEIEMYGRKNTSEYDALMSALKFYLNEEQEIYEKIGTNLDRVNAYLDYLFPDGSPDFEDGLELVKDGRASEMMKTRIAERLYKIKLDFALSEEEQIDTEIDDDYFDNTNLETSIEKDIVNTLLAILNKFIKDDKYRVIKDRLVKLKYNLAFIYDFVEENLGINLFNIPDTLYWQSKFMFDLIQREDIDLQKIIKTYTDSILDYQFDSIDKFVNEDLNEIEKLTIIAFMQIYFRTCILFLSDRDLENLKKTLQLEIPLLGINDLLVEEGIRNIFKEMKSDRELPHLTSLSPNLN